MARPPARHREPEERQSQPFECIGMKVKNQRILFMFFMVQKAVFMLVLAVPEAAG